MAPRSRSYLSINGARASDVSMPFGNAHRIAASGTVPALERQTRLAEIRAEIAGREATFHELSEAAAEIASAAGEAARLTDSSIRLHRSDSFRALGLVAGRPGVGRRSVGVRRLDWFTRGVLPATRRRIADVLLPRFTVEMIATDVDCIVAGRDGR